MTTRFQRPLRDYSVLTPRQYRVIRNRSEPLVPDTEALAEIEHRRKMHQGLQSTVNGWTNTIAHDRQERQTRLQREAAAAEQRQVVLDTEERKYQKLKRQAKLAEARTLQFMERPEVRAVNSQLLLHEVQLERDMQLEAKNRKRLSEMKKQMQFDEQYRRRYEEMLEYENEQLRQRRLKAIEVAEEFKRQKAAKEAEKKSEKEADQKEEQILALQMAWEADQEREALRTARRIAMEHVKENQRWNTELVRYKETMGTVEEEEEIRLKKLREQIFTEEEERKAAELKRKNDRLARTQKLIDIETKRQMNAKQCEDDFLDRQIERQFEKESRRVAEVTARKRKLENERKMEHDEVMALKEEKEREKLERSRKKEKFTFEGVDEDVLKLERREQERKRACLDLQQFQRDQAREKKERDGASREREILEELHHFEEDRDFLERARKYANEKLREAKALEDENDRKLPSLY
jgi:hypothetical protein